MELSGFAYSLVLGLTYGLGMVIGSIYLFDWISILLTTLVFILSFSLIGMFFDYIFKKGEKK